MVDALVALALLGVALVPLIHLGLGMDRQSELDARHEHALAAARAALESHRHRPYGELVAGDLDQRPDLGTGEAGEAGEADSAAHPATVHVTVVSREVEPGLVELRAIATWRSVTGRTSRLELPTLVADADQSSAGRYALEGGVRS